MQSKSKARWKHPVHNKQSHNWEPYHTNKRSDKKPREMDRNHQIAAATMKEIPGPEQDLI